jgi:hypothetical protein
MTVAPRLPGRSSTTKLLVFGVVGLGLVGIMVWAAVREGATARPNTARPALAPSRPPFTASEDAYARALWPIHNEVKAAALRMTFGGLNFKIGEIDRAELRARIESSRNVHRGAETRIRELRPPASLLDVHTEYVEAVRLYQQSAVEMLKVAEDGRDEHLVTAFPMSQEAGRKLLRVGNVLWPGEYVPN